MEFKRILNTEWKGSLNWNKKETTFTSDCYKKSSNASLA